MLKAIPDYTAVGERFAVLEDGTLIARNLPPYLARLMVASETFVACVTAPDLDLKDAESAAQVIALAKAAVGAARGVKHPVAGEEAVPL